MRGLGGGLATDSGDRDDKTIRSLSPAPLEPNTLPLVERAVARLPLDVGEVGEVDVAVVAGDSPVALSRPFHQRTVHGERAAEIR
jgi:hypothetical protein